MPVVAVYLFVWLPCISRAEVVPDCAHCTSVEALPQPGAALLQVAKTKGALGVARDDPVGASKHLIAAKASAQAAAASKPEPVAFEFDKGTAIVSNSRISRLEGIHRVVGDDGVLMISLDRQGRFNYTHAKLQEAGIWGTRFPAVDGKDPAVTQEMLDAACNREGCLTRPLQALVASHRNAWLHAQTRTPDWTAVFEDDVIPGAKASSWQAAFEAAWAQVPNDASIVRLGRCVSLESSWGQLDFVSPIDAGEFVITKGKGFDEHTVVGCMQAYMIHKTAIPMLLSLLPCPYILDACVVSMFEQPGQSFLFNIDPHISKDIDYSALNQIGVVVQDWKNLMNTSTTREAQVEIAKR